MSGDNRKQDNLPSEASIDPASEVPRSGSGADTALLAMLRKRQMRAGAEPQPQPAPPRDDGRKSQRK
jgi:hypothetical protein